MRSSQAKAESAKRWCIRLGAALVAFTLVAFVVGLVIKTEPAQAAVAATPSTSSPASINSNANAMADRSSERPTVKPPQEYVPGYYTANDAPKGSGQFGPALKQTLVDGQTRMVYKLTHDPLFAAIVEEMVKTKQADPSKLDLAKIQARAHHFEANASDWKQAVKDMDNQVKSTSASYIAGAYDTLGMNTGSNGSMPTLFKASMTKDQGYTLSVTLKDGTILEFRYECDLQPAKHRATPVPAPHTVAKPKAPPTVPAAHVKPPKHSTVKPPAPPKTTCKDDDDNCTPTPPKPPTCKHDCTTTPPPSCEDDDSCTTPPPNCDDTDSCTTPPPSCEDDDSCTTPPPSCEDDDSCTTPPHSKPDQTADCMLNHKGSCAPNAVVQPPADDNPGDTPGTTHDQPVDNPNPVNNDGTPAPNPDQGTDHSGGYNSGHNDGSGTAHGSTTGDNGTSTDGSHNGTPDNTHGVGDTDHGNTDGSSDHIDMPQT